MINGDDCAIARCIEYGSKSISSCDECNKKLKCSKYLVRNDVPKKRLSNLTNNSSILDRSPRLARDFSLLLIITNLANILNLIRIIPAMMGISSAVLGILTAVAFIIKAFIIKKMSQLERDYRKVAIEYFIFACFIGITSFIYSDKVWFISYTIACFLIAESKFLKDETNVHSELLSSFDTSLSALWYGNGMFIFIGVIFLAVGLNFATHIIGSLTIAIGLILLIIAFTRLSVSYYKSKKRFSNKSSSR